MRSEKLSRKESDLPFRMICRSAAADASWYYFSRYRLLFDCGACEEKMMGARHLVLSHAHMDHLSGLFSLVSRKNLLKTPILNLYAPSWIREDIRSVFEILYRLNESCGWEMNWIDFDPGSIVKLDKKLILRSFEAFHRPPAISVLLSETRKRMKNEFECLQEKDKETKQNMCLENFSRLCCEDFEYPLIFYSGDSGKEIFSHTILFEAELCILECTFLDSEHVNRAREHGHIHFFDILENAKNFRNKNLLLTHFSPRYAPEHILSVLQKERGRFTEVKNLFVNLPRQETALIPI